MAVVGRCAGQCTAPRPLLVAAEAEAEAEAEAAAAAPSGGPSGQPNHPPPRARRRPRHQPLVASCRSPPSPSPSPPRDATPLLPFNTVACACTCSRLLRRDSGYRRSRRRRRRDEAAEGAAGAAAGGQLRHGRHHAALPLRPHLHQGALLLHPLPQTDAGGGGGGGGGGRGLRQHAVQEEWADRGGGLRPEPADVLRDEQAVGAVRGGGRHPRRRQPLRHLHQPARPGVEDQAVRAPPRRRRHGRRPRVHAGPLRRRERHRRAAALHQEPLHPGLPLLQRRLRRQPLPRLHRRAGPPLREHQPLRRRGALPHQRDQGLVGGQVHPLVPAALQVRHHRRRQRPGGALLPQDLHRRDVPQGHGHRPLALPRRRHRRRLQAPPPASLPPGARDSVPHGRAPALPPAPPHHLPQELPPLPERARHGARRRRRPLRRAHRRAGQPHRHAQLRAPRQLRRRDGRRPRRRPHQHGVPPQPRRGHPGRPLRRARVAHPRHLQGPRRRHGRHLHGVQRLAGGELAARPLPRGSLLPPTPLRRPQERLGRH